MTGENFTQVDEVDVSMRCPFTATLLCLSPTHLGSQDSCSSEVGGCFCLSWHMLLWKLPLSFPSLTWWLLTAAELALSCCGTASQTLCFITGCKTSFMASVVCAVCVWLLLSTGGVILNCKVRRISTAWQWWGSRGPVRVFRKPHDK